MNIRKIINNLAILYILCGWGVSQYESRIYAVEVERSIKLAAISDSRIQVDPLLQNLPNMSITHFMLHRPLILISEDGLPLCELCKEIPSFENDQLEFVIQNAEKLIVSQWNIRDGLKWGDGTPITASDFFAVWELVRTGQLYQKDSLLFRSIREIQIYPEQPLKLTITFFRDQFDMNALMHLFPVPASYLQENLKLDVKAKFGAYNLTSPYLREPYNPGLYSGPYVLSQISAQSMQLKRNSFFYGSKPEFENAIVDYFPSIDKVQDFAKYLFIDLSWSDATLAKETNKKIPMKDRKKLLLSQRFWPSLYSSVWVNPDRIKKFDSQLIEAIFNAIHRQELLKKSGLDEYVPIHDLDFFRQIRITNNFSDIDKRNLEGRELLRKLLREYAESSDLEFDRKKDTAQIAWLLAYNEKNLEGKKVAEALQLQLSRFGFKVTLRALSPELYFNTEALKEVDLLIVNQLKQPGDAISEHFGLAHRKNNAVASKIFVPWRWQNETAMQVAELLQNEHRAIKREEYWQKFLSVFREDAPFIPLYFKSRFAIYGSDLQLRQNINADLPLTIKIEEWSEGQD